MTTHGHRSSLQQPTHSATDGFSGIFRSLWAPWLPLLRSTRSIVSGFIITNLLRPLGADVLCFDFGGSVKLRVDHFQDRSSSRRSYVLINGGGMSSVGPTSIPRRNLLLRTPYKK